ncbi:MAG: hypothetical protein JF595_05140 [Sphingomonadales bacterium]|nr:hypothetical protein [Sphingomonadales bacterium]
MLSNDIYITIREAIDYTAEERGRLYDPEHEAHYMAMMVIQALACAGYTIGKRQPELA